MRVSNSTEVERVRKYSTQVEVKSIAHLKFTFFFTFNRGRDTKKGWTKGVKLSSGRATALYFLDITPIKYLIQPI